MKLQVISQSGAHTDSPNVSIYCIRPEQETNTLWYHGTQHKIKKKAEELLGENFVALKRIYWDNRLFLHVRKGTSKGLLRREFRDLIGWIRTEFR